MLVTRRVLLGLEKCIKVPEGALNEVVSRHLCEPGGRYSLTVLLVPSGWAGPTPAPCSPHLQEDLPELRADLEERVQVAAVWEDAMGQEVVRLEGPVPPGAAVKGCRVRGPGEGCPPSPTCPSSWGHPLPGDHLWAQLCLLLGDAGAEGTAFAHPVGLQGPVARQEEGTPLSPPSRGFP